MKYHIRNNQKSGVDGPYSACELVDMLQTGSISEDTLVSSDLGEGSQSLMSFRKCDWFPASSVPEIAKLAPEVPDLSIQDRKRLLTLRGISRNCIVVDYLCVSASKTSDTVLGICALVMAGGVVIEMFQYRKQVLGIQSAK